MDRSLDADFGFAGSEADALDCVPNLFGSLAILRREFERDGSGFEVDVDIFHAAHALERVGEIFGTRFAVHVADEDADFEELGSRGKGNQEEGKDANHPHQNTPAQTGPRTGDMNGVVLLTESGTAELKKRALAALGTLPPFSPILNRLMGMLAGEDVSFAKLGELIEKDTVVAGNLLRLVNSALYARRGTVNSVRRALALLGMEKTRNAILGMSLTKMWSRVSVPREWSVARFNMHSAAVAILSDLVAQRIEVEYPEGAFVAGLLHDLGQLLIAVGLPERYAEIESREREAEIFGFTHAELSAEALAIWNLPEAIRSAVRYHHAPELDDSGNGPVRLCRVVWAANQYVNAIGVSIEATGDPQFSDVSAIGRLGLDEASVKAMLGEFETEYEAMAQYFRPN